MENAGYEILESKNYLVTNHYANGICLGKHKSDKCPQRYVTWEYTDKFEKGTYSFYWGHYYESRAEAYRDYYNRLANHFDKPWEEE